MSNPTITAFPSPALREMARQTALFNSLTVREMARQAALFNSLTVREMARQAALFNNPALKEMVRQTAMFNSPTDRAAQERVSDQAYSLKPSGVYINEPSYEFVSVSAIVDEAVDEITARLAPLMQEASKLAAAQAETPEKEKTKEQKQPREDYQIKATIAHYGVTKQQEKQGIAAQKANTTDKTYRKYRDNDWLLDEQEFKRVTGETIAARWAELHRN